MTGKELLEKLTGLTESELSGQVVYDDWFRDTRGQINHVVLELIVTKNKKTIVLS